MYIDRCIYIYSLCEHNMHRFVMSTYIYTHTLIIYVHTQAKHICTIHTEINISLNIHVFARLRAQPAPVPHLYTDIHMYLYTSRHRCIYIHMGTDMYIQRYIHIHMYRNIYTYIYIHTFKYVHVHTHKKM